MQFSEGVQFKTASLDELLSIWPAMEWLLHLLVKLGVLRRVVQLEVRDPIGWWEWFWSLLGWQYKEAVEYLHLDFLYLVTWTLVVVMVMACIWAAFNGLVILARWSLKQAVMLIARAFGKLGEIFSCVFRLLASAWEPGAMAKVVVPSARSLPYNTESIRLGSILTKFDIPGCQVVFGVVNGERFLAHGCGIRVSVPTHDDAFIITPLHVLCGLPDVFHLRGKAGTIKVDKTLCVRGTKSSTREYLELDTDMGAFPITPVEASQIGVSVASILPRLERGVLAKIVGPSGEGSTGELKACSFVFGQLVYNGSTLAGFSGAGYLVGKSVVGIHVAGGSRNVGYSLRLAYVTLLHFIKVKPEDTDEWLENIVKNKRYKIEVDPAWQHLDTVRIRVKGEYHIVDRDSYNNLELQYEPTEPTYDDASSSVVRKESSKNELQSTNGASDSSTASLQGEIQKLRLKTKNQQNTLRSLQAKLQILGEKQKTPTSGQIAEQIPESQS